MAKGLKVAGEVDSYCTKCKMVLNHRIVSMVGTKPHQVLCLTCNSPHLFRARAPGERAARTSSAPGSSGPRSTGSRAPKAPSMAAQRAEQARAEQEQVWRKAIAGRAVNDFTPYKISHVFQEGQLIAHKRFGDGVVARVIDAAKVEVLFQDASRVLGQGQPTA